MSHRRGTSRLFLVLGSVCALVMLGHTADVWVPGQPAPGCSVLIVAFGGGWGRTAMEQETQLVSVVAGLDSTLRRRGLTSKIVQYHLTPDDGRPRIAVFAEIVGLRRARAAHLAASLSEFCRRPHHPWVILVGLSNGAAFMNNILTAADPDVENEMLGIELGTPFWNPRSDLANSLFFDNGGIDPLPNGEVYQILPLALLGVARCLADWLRGDEIEVGPAFRVPQHSYCWRQTGREITEFVDRRYRLRRRNVAGNVQPAPAARSAK